jgi:hypothetical protein
VLKLYIESVFSGLQQRVVHVLPVTKVRMVSASTRKFLAITIQEPSSNMQLGQQTMLHRFLKVSAQLMLHHYSVQA